MRRRARSPADRRSCSSWRASSWPIPSLILLDEPGAGVNPTLMRSLVAAIRDLHARGMTFLLIEHDMDLITELCDPVIVLAEGRRLVEGPFAEVRRDPRVLEAYLGMPA